MSPDPTQPKYAHASSADADAWTTGYDSHEQAAQEAREDGDYEDGFITARQNDTTIVNLAPTAYELLNQISEHEDTPDHVCDHIEWFLRHAGRTPQATVAMQELSDLFAGALNTWWAKHGLEIDTFLPEDIRTHEG